MHCLSLSNLFINAHIIIISIALHFIMLIKSNTRVYLISNYFTLIIFYLSEVKVSHSSLGTNVDGNLFVIDIIHVNNLSYMCID